MFSEGLSVDFHASEGATVRSSGEAAGSRNSIRQHSQRCLAGPNAVILHEEQATRKSAFLRGSRRPSSAVVETEFGLSRPKPQRQGPLLLRRTVLLGRAEFLISLPRIFLPLSFPPIAASVASLWLKSHDSRSARSVSTACSASGSSRVHWRLPQGMLKFGFPTTRLLGRDRLPPRFRWRVRRAVSLRGVRSSLVASNWNERQENRLAPCQQETKPMVDSVEGTLRACLQGRRCITTATGTRCTHLCSS